MAFDFPSSPTTGQTYSISGGPTYVYNGTAWVVLTPGNQFNRTVFTATAGQTTFTMNYVVGAVDVYRNGVKMAPADFTATNGTSIVLLNAATVGDTVEVISYPMITYSDAVKRTGDTMTGALAVPALTVNSVPVLAGPAFSAYASNSQTLTSTVFTKLALNVKDFDTNSNFDNTLYRFTPTVAGYYQINGAVAFTVSGSGKISLVSIQKNGSEFKRGAISPLTSGDYSISTVSSIIYMNGTTDYLELWAVQTSGSNLATIANFVHTYFNGSLVRAA